MADNLATRVGNWFKFHLTPCIDAQHHVFYRGEKRNDKIHSTYWRLLGVYVFAGM